MANFEQVISDQLCKISSTLEKIKQLNEAWEKRETTGIVFFTIPEAGGMRSFSAGKTKINFLTGVITNPDGSLEYMDRNLNQQHQQWLHSISVDTDQTIKLKILPNSIRTIDANFSTQIPYLNYNEIEITCTVTTNISIFACTNPSAVIGQFKVPSSVGISGTVSTSVLNTSREIQGKYGGSLYTVALDESGKLIARVQGKYGNSLLDAAVDSSGRLITTSAITTQRSNAAMDETTYAGVGKSGNNYVLASDLYSFNKYDPNNKLTVTAAKVDVVGDFGGNTRMAALMNSAVGDFSYNFEYYSTVSGSDSTFIIGVANEDAQNNDANFNGVGVRRYPTDLAPAKFVNGVLTLGTAIALSLSTLYYCRIARSGTTLTLSVFSDSGRTAHVTGSPQTLSVVNTSFQYMHMVNDYPPGGSSRSYYLQNISPLDPVALSGNIKSNAIAATASAIRYWQTLRMNLSKGASTHANPLRIKFLGSSDSYAAALNSNWVTIPESEYAELDLERAAIKTATSNVQTVWDFTSLTGADALINEIGAQSVLVVERANDGSTYSVMTEHVDYEQDITSRIAPRITLLSGTGIVSGTSKLRVTMVVDVLKTDQATKNTSIKVQIQENRTATSESSPSIQPMPTDAATYVSAIWVSS